METVENAPSPPKRRTCTPTLSLSTSATLLTLEVASEVSTTVANVDVSRTTCSTQDVGRVPPRAPGWSEPQGRGLAPHLGPGGRRAPRAPVARARLDTYRALERVSAARFPSSSMSVAFGKGSA